MNPEIEQWLSWDKKDAKTIKEMSSEELKKAFSSRMAFGTAGLRSTMGPGPSQMNDLTIIQTSQGLIKYAQNQFGAENLKTRGLVVGYDARYNSHHWSGLLAQVCKEQGVKCYTFNKIVPTPYVPFAIKKYQACVGVMITASHNPKEDNGYKVYWDNGSQIIPPHDSGISEEILKNLAPWSERVWNGKNNGSMEVLQEVNADYMTVLAQHSHSDNSESKLKIVYTPVHGVGHDYVKEGLTKVFKFSEFHGVPEQYKPDPDFPTVVFPNPEEGKGVLELSFAHADKVGSNLVHSAGN